MVDWSMNVFVARSGFSLLIFLSIVCVTSRVLDISLTVDQESFGSNSPFAVAIVTI
jgi:hypothetical protein